MELLRDLLDLATECAYLGGKRTLAYFNTGVAVETKADLTPVTRADREAEQLIRERIASIYPAHSILGEEEGESDSSSDYRWIVDPIDGTKTFIRGVPLYGTMIGVEYQGRAIAGACYIPALDEMIAAADGLGCWHNSRRASVSSTVDLSEATLLCSDAEFNRRRSGAFNALSSKVKITRTWGDVYGYLLVATGRADIMIDAELNPWDCAPLVPILKEAGGIFSSWKGEITHRGGDGVATNCALHPKIIEILRSHDTAIQ
jgi:histidinol-phosphatase